jgi:hypothetical protein
VRPLTADQLRVRRARFEGALLKFLRDPADQDARRDMRDALSDLERLPQRGLPRSFWWVVRGLLDALEASAIEVDVDLKRVLARVNLQLRRLIDGGGAVAERLLVDALYYIGRADPQIVPAWPRRGSCTGSMRCCRPTSSAPGSRCRCRSRARAARVAGRGQVGLGPGGQRQRRQDPVRSAHRDRARSRGVDRPCPGRPAAGGDRNACRGFCRGARPARETLAIEVATALLLVDLGVDELPSLDERFEAGRSR